MEEKRRHKRYTLDPIDIRNEMVFAADVTLIDIGLGGLSVKADRRLNLGCDYVVKIRAKDKMIDVKGEVVWAVLSGHKENALGDVVPLYKAGLKFGHLSDEKLMDLAKFIEAHKKEDAGDLLVCQLYESRLFKRVKIDLPGRASVLHHYGDCKVKKLSVSGMLMVSEFPIEVEDIVPMRLTFTEEKSVTFKGRIASCILVDDTPPAIYDIGVEFLDMSKEDQGTLKEFIGLLETIDKSTSSL